MTLPIFLLNIGNTHVQLAELRDGKPCFLTRFDTPEVLKTPNLIADSLPSPARIIASCVVPKLKDALTDEPNLNIRFLKPQDFPQLDFSLVDTSTLGVDRICNAAAILNYNGRGPVAVFDCGTCMTSIIIDAQNRFRGGTIAPGRQLLRHALHDHTGQLPLVPIYHTKPDLIGPNTEAAIRSGVDLGALGTLDFLVNQTRLALNAPDCPVYITGGDAQFFLQSLPNLHPAPELLTLQGIASALPLKGSQSRSRNLN